MTKWNILRGTWENSQCVWHEKTISFCHVHVVNITWPRRACAPRGLHLLLLLLLLLAILHNCTTVQRYLARWMWVRRALRTRRSRRAFSCQGPANVQSRRIIKQGIRFDWGFVYTVGSSSLARGQIGPGREWSESLPRIIISSDPDQKWPSCFDSVQLNWLGLLITSVRSDELLKVNTRLRTGCQKKFWRSVVRKAPDTLPGA